VAVRAAALTAPVAGRQQGEARSLAILGALARLLQRAVQQPVAMALEDRAPRAAAMLQPASSHIVQFVAGSGNTVGSYILPAFYQTWACFDTANASYWNSAITAGRTFFHNAIDANGVIGDQSSFTGQTTKAAGPDTIRCVANIMMDHNYFNVDAWQSQTYAPLYGPYVTSHPQNSTAATSANGLLGFGLPEATGKPFVDKVWSLAIPTGTWRYYDGCWYMMSLLHMSGAFKLWY